MLKSKLKIALIVFLAIILISSLSFATSTRSVTDDVAEISEDSEDVTAISEDHEDHEETEDIISSVDDSWVSSDLFICEDTVVVDKIVDGNAFIIGKDVTITGEIGGDLFVIAEKLTIEGGYVYSSIFTCAKDITINGIVYDVYALTNNFTLSEDGFIYRDLRVLGDSININGKVKRNVFAEAANYNVSETALIGGNLEYSSNEDITIPTDVVTGEVTRNNVEETTEEVESIGSIILSYVSDLVKTLVYTFIVVLLLLWLAPKFVDKISQMSIGKDFASIGIGFAAILATIIGGFILLITVIGIPLAISAILILSLLISISFSITSIFFGKLFTKLLKLEGKVKFVLITLASSVILWSICKLPFIGWLASFLITLFGVGAIIINIVCKKETKVEETK